MSILQKTSSLPRSPPIQTRYYSHYPEKVTALEKLKEPNNIGDLHYFFGLIGYYKKFVPLFIDITKPLNMLHKKDIKISVVTTGPGSF